MVDEGSPPGVRLHPAGQAADRFLFGRGQRAVKGQEVIVLILTHARPSPARAAPPGFAARRWAVPADDDARPQLQGRGGDQVAREVDGFQVVVQVSGISLW